MQQVNKLIKNPVLDLARRGAAIRELDLEIALKYPRDRASSCPLRAQASSRSIGRHQASVLVPPFNTELEAIFTLTP
jgi:hypothetical protein